MIFLVYKSTNINLKKLKVLSVFIAPFLVFVGLYILFSSDVLVNEAKSNFYPLSLENMNFLFNNFKYSIEGIAFSLTIAGTLLSVAGFLLLFKDNRDIFYFLILFFIPLYIFYTTSNTIAHRFFSLPLIPLIVPFSYTLYHIKKKDSYAATLLFILFAIVFFLNIYPVIKYRHEFSAFKDLAAMVKSNTNPDDSVVILYGDDTPALNYYSKTPTKSCDYYQDIKSLNNFISSVDNLLMQGLKVYISGSCFGLGNYSERAMFLEQMGKNFKGSVVAEYTSDDYHRGSIKPTIKKISMLKLYDKKGTKGIDLHDLIIKY